MAQQKPTELSDAVRSTDNEPKIQATDERSATVSTLDPIADDGDPVCGAIDRLALRRASPEVVDNDIALNVHSACGEKGLDGQKAAIEASQAEAEPMEVDGKGLNGQAVIEAEEDEVEAEEVVLLEDMDKPTALDKLSKLLGF